MNTVAIPDVLEIVPKNKSLQPQISSLQNDYLHEDYAIEQCGRDYFLMYGHVKKQEEIRKRILSLANEECDVQQQAYTD